jgi:hypothetical protein
MPRLAKVVHLHSFTECIHLRQPGCRDHAGRDFRPLALRPRLSTGLLFRISIDTLYRIVMDFHFSFKQYQFTGMQRQSDGQNNQLGSCRVYIRTRVSELYTFPRSLNYLFLILPCHFLVANAVPAGGSPRRGRFHLFLQIFWPCAYILRL